MVQRVKPVTLAPKEHPDDLTIVNIPCAARAAPKWFLP